MATKKQGSVKSTDQVQLSPVDLTTEVGGTVLPRANGGTGFGTYALGDTLHGNGSNDLAKLAGNTEAVKKVLTQLGTGAVSAAPVWEVPDHTYLLGAVI